MNDFNTVHVINGVLVFHGMLIFISGSYFVGCDPQKNLVSSLINSPLDSEKDLLHFAKVTMGGFFMAIGVFNVILFLSGFCALRKRTPGTFNVYFALMGIYVLLNISGISLDWAKLDSIYKRTGNKYLVRLWVLVIGFHCIAMAIAVVLIVATLHLVKNNESLKWNKRWGIINKNENKKEVQPVSIMITIPRDITQELSKTAEKTEYESESKSQKHEEQ